MKILGYTYYNQEHRFTMKCDASLLNQRKPFFMPDWAEHFCFIPCTVARISRLGKCIAPKFASRYYDAIAPGLDFIAADYVANDYSRATAFDGSLCVGEFMPLAPDSVNPEIDKAIADLSRIVTLRMGDLIYIDHPIAPTQLQREQIIEQEHLFCKIK